MDILELLQREWPLISGAPVLAIGGAVVTALTAFWIGWGLKGAIDGGQVRASRERLELARDREADAREKQAELERQIADLGAQINLNAPSEELKKLKGKVDAALLGLQTANNGVQHALNAETGNYRYVGAEASADIFRRDRR